MALTACVVLSAASLTVLCACAAGTSSFQSLATPAIPDPIGTLLNQNTNYANIISSAHPDPVPNNIVNQLIENPLGPQLDAAFKALPSLQARTPSSSIATCMHACNFHHGTIAPGSSHACAPVVGCALYGVRIG